MRKAFTLIELLVVVTVLPIVMVAISGVYATFIRDIPRTTRVLQENTTVLDLLGQMRRDVDGAVGLPEQFEGRHASERTLLIEQPGQVICYQIEDGRIVRTVLTGGIAKAFGLDDGEPPVTASHRQAALDDATLENSAAPPSLEASQSQDRLWRMRNAVIAWRLWERDGRAYAVEIHSHVKQRVDGFQREKLANTQVFFPHGLVKEGEIR
jgi:prepilin-type N-terminal cleavage/methylation domain-containing protein